ncbi:type VII secretion target [Sanguibacter sp. 25GB23B1]|uniref:type VII secretion target n=1 Tax=unclassified Sanguibacter TaxID=2645534 RepID=UPI0032AE991D
MADQVEVDYAAVQLAAREHLTLATRTDTADRARRSADLPSGSLGKLPAADELQATFDAQYVAVGDALTKLSEIFESVRDRLTATVDRYEATDTSVASMMELGLGALDSASPAPFTRVPL